MKIIFARSDGYYVLVVFLVFPEIEPTTDLIDLAISGYSNSSVEITQIITTQFPSLGTPEIATSETLKANVQTLGKKKTIKTTIFLFLN